MWFLHRKVMLTKDNLAEIMEVRSVVFMTKTKRYIIFLFHVHLQSEYAHRPCETLNLSPLTSIIIFYELCVRC
jgi:hypothetical protein